MFLDVWVTSQPCCSRSVRLHKGELEPSQSAEYPYCLCTHTEQTVDASVFKSQLVVPRVRMCCSPAPCWRGQLVPVLWEGSAVPLLSLGYGSLFSQMQLHGLNQVFTPTVDLDSVKGFQRLERDLFGMK